MENTLEHIFKNTFDDNPSIRAKAVRELCPCKIKEDYSEIWERLLELVDDPNDQVRMNVLHTICDGSPEHVGEHIEDILNKFGRDTNKEIKRKSHKVMASYLKTGKWNVL